MRNDFVDYLNTLHRCNGSNDNTIAEKNFESKHGQSLIVQNKGVFENIKKCFENYSGKFILTGDAGDGKTTIAFDFAQYYQCILGFTKIDTKDTVELLHPSDSKHKIIIVKDFSERDVAQDPNFINTILLNPDIRLLLVSNTGTLLNFFKNNHLYFNLTSIDIEKTILDAISNNDGIDKFQLTNEISFQVQNIAQFDNLELGQKVLNKIVNNDGWTICKNCPCRDRCHIFLNRNLLRDKVVIERLFLMYRRMYEYNERFTMRQLSEHFAYMITSGLGCKNYSRIKDENLLFNTVFGYGYPAAQKTRVIASIIENHFGSSIPPIVEREIWILGTKFSVPDTLIDFRDKYMNGNKKFDKDDILRTYLYRMLYFTSDLKNLDSQDFSLAYTVLFLNSPGLVYWMKLQGTKGNIQQVSSLDIQNIRRRVVHVIKEYFAGVKLPESANSLESQIYITINRQEKSIIQTAQAVLGAFEASRLEVSCSEDVSRKIYQFYLVYRNLQTIDDSIKLKLGLAFLDYLFNRHLGQLDNDEIESFQKRLDVFRNKILKSIQKYNGNQFDNSMLLVKLDYKMNLSNLTFKLVDDKLEVSR